MKAIANPPLSLKATLDVEVTFEIEVQALQDLNQAVLVMRNENGSKVKMMQNGLAVNPAKSSSFDLKANQQDDIPITITFTRNPRRPIGINLTFWVEEGGIIVSETAPVPCALLV